MIMIHQNISFIITNSLYSPNNSGPCGLFVCCIIIISKCHGIVINVP